MIECFEPIIDSNSTILILGTAPSVKSLELNQYYANPRNQFWKILYTLYDKKCQQEYAKRKDFLSTHHIALWDVVKHCDREGSLDVAIKNEEPNDFTWLFNTYPSIRAVIFNGLKACKIFKKEVGFEFEGVEFYQLCSTSPAHTVKFEKKLDEWGVIIEYTKDII